MTNLISVQNYGFMRDIPQVWCDIKQIPAERTSVVAYRYRDVHLAFKYSHDQPTEDIMQLE